MQPEDLRDVAGREFLITWEDGHRSLYPYPYLRSRCGCAACLDEWSGRRRIDPGTIPQDIRPLQWMEVGRYALRFEWSDGHKTGIYSFDLLRQLCPCEKCRAR